ncbi:ribosomal protein L35A [Nemania serpens]|nr:ribosomal protein L35A [Nemania serpens]
MPSEAGHRLYVKARHLGYRRNKHTTHPNKSLVKIEGVDDTEAANFYLGKKIAFIHKAPKEIRGTQTRVIWGKVVRLHGIVSPDSRVQLFDAANTHPALGNSGAVQARFSTPLPTKSFGASLRVLLYPSSV